VEPFVEQLKTLCREHPTRSKWVFVPAHGIGHTLGDRLALEAGGWANLRLVTPFDVALRMGAPFLVERGIDPSEEGLGPALIMRLLLGLPESHTYFRPLAHQPELARALWSTVTELRMAGVRAANLAPGAFASAAKHAELAALLGSYEDFLTSKNRGDRATVFDEAMQHADWCPIQKQDCWTELPDVVWSALERRLIDSMPGEHIRAETLALPSTKVPARLAEAPVIRVTPDDSKPLAFLLAPEPRNTGTSEPRNPEPRHPGTPAPRNLQFFHSGGAEAEVEEIFRRVLASGKSLDEVEIVCAQPPLQTLVWEKCLRCDWPATMADGLPAAMTKPGRALLAFTEWVEDDFSAGRLRKLLQSGDVVLDDVVGLSPGRAARLLVKAEAAWGRETYAIRLGRMARTDRARANRDDIPETEREWRKKSADEADALAAWIGKLIASVPENGAGALFRLPQPPEKEPRPRFQSVVDCALHFVEHVAAQTNALDAAAATALGAALGDLRALGDFQCSLADALRFVVERVHSVRIGADRPRPGHLHVSNLRTAAFSSRRLVFFAGLEEGRVFPSGFEDPILLDTERQAIHSSLPRAGDRIDEAVYAAIARMAAASARPDTEICFSYSCRDLREFRQTYASWLMLQAYRVQSGNPRASYKDLHEHLGSPVSCVPDAPDRVLSPSRWWLQRLLAAGPAGRSALIDQYPSLAAGVRAAEARASNQFTEFDGHVPEAGKLLDPANADRVVSATELEGAARCGFRYFLERGLNVRAIESGDRDRDVWLSPLLKGTLLHDLYAELMRRARTDNREISKAADLDWMLERGRTSLAEIARDMPPPSSEVHDREGEELLADLALFVEEESRIAATRVPVGFEVAFGRARRADSDPIDNEPLASADPVIIDIGDGLSFRLAGQIDRIDLLKEAGSDPKEAGSLDPAQIFEIIDYKTGGYWKQDYDGVFGGGTKLQHALYGLAALELLKRSHKKASVARASYVFPTHRGNAVRKEIAAPVRAKVDGVLADLRTVIASGLFLHTDDEKRCKFCDHGLACAQQDSVRQAAAKQADPVLAPVVRLGEHE
jgi:hypothetical protein